MALSTGSFTVHGASSVTSFNLTTDGSSLVVASSVAGLTANEILTTAMPLYVGSSAAFVAVGPSLGNAAVLSTAPTTVLGADGTNVFFSDVSSSLVLTGNGNDTVIAPSGNDTIDPGAGNNVLYLGSGTASVNSAGTDTIFAGTGAETVNVSSSASINAGTGGLSILGAGANVTVNGANGAAVTIYGGSGSTAYVSGSAANNVFVANDSTKGASGGSVVFNGASATGGSQFWAGSGNATLIGGSGNDTLVAGQGASTMTGAGGTNEFDFFTVQGGSNTSAAITDFETAGASDSIKLFNYGTSAAATAFSSAAQVGSNTVITLSDSSTITLLNFSKSNLTASEILSTPPNPTA